MDAQQTTTVMTPVIQYGFAGFCVVLLAILVWLITQLLKILKENNIVISTNTAAITRVDGHSEATLKVAIECKEELLKRPCIAKFKTE
jgi:hypothetical protein